MSNLPAGSDSYPPDDLHDFDPLDGIREDMRKLLYTLYDEFCTMDVYGVWEDEVQRREVENQIDQLVTAYRALDGDMLWWSHTKETIARRCADA